MNISSSQPVVFIDTLARNFGSFAQIQANNVGRLCQSLIGTINTFAQRIFGQQLAMIATGIVVTVVVLGSCYLLWKCICVLRCSKTTTPPPKPPVAPEPLFDKQLSKEALELLENCDQDLVKKADDGDSDSCGSLAVQCREKAREFFPDKKDMGIYYYLAAVYCSKMKSDDLESSNKVNELTFLNLEDSAKSGNLEGILCLIKCYEKGLLGQSIDHNKASEAYYKAAEIYFKSNNTEEAKKMCLKALEQDFDRTADAVKMLLTKLNDSDKNEHVEALLKLEQTHKAKLDQDTLCNFHLYTANNFFTNKNEAKGIEHSQKAFEYKNSIDAVLLVAKYSNKDLSRLFPVGLDKTWYPKIAERYLSEALGALESNHSCNPNKVMARIKIALQYEPSKVKALPKIFQDTLSINPNVFSADTLMVMAKIYEDPELVTDGGMLAGQYYLLASENLYGDGTITDEEIQKNTLETSLKAVELGFVGAREWLDDTLLQKEPYKILIAEPEYKERLEKIMKTNV